MTLVDANGNVLDPTGILNDSVPVSPRIRALADYPVMSSPYTITVQTVSAGLAGATSTVTGTLMTPLWTASTFYPAGAVVMHPTDNTSVIRRTAIGTSRATYDATEQALWTTAPDGTQVNYPMRWNSNFIRGKTVNATLSYGSRAPAMTNGDQDNATRFQPTTWSVDFDWDTVAGALEVGVYDIGQLRFIVDGQYVSTTPTTVGTDNYGWQYVKLSGVTAGYHRVRVEIGGAWNFIGGIKIATADVVYPPSLPTTKRLAIVGDSFGEGYTGAAGGTAAPDIRGYVPQVARLLGFTDIRNLSIAGSGFTTPATSLYGTRISDLVLLQPDYIVVQGSSNDQANVASLSSAAQTFYAAIKAQCPNAKVLVTGQLNHTGSGDTITPALQTAAAAAGVPFLDTTGWAVNGPTNMNVDGVHPTVIGHEYLARRLAAAIAGTWGLPV